MRGEMRRLRQQRPQDRHELRRGDVLEHDRLRHVVGAGSKARVRVGHDLERIAGVERDETMNLEHGLEQSVEGRGRHRRVRQYGDLRPNAWVDDDRATDDLRDLLGDHSNVGVPVVRRQLRSLLRQPETAGEQAERGADANGDQLRPSRPPRLGVAPVARKLPEIHHSRFS